MSNIFDKIYWSLVILTALLLASCLGIMDRVIPVTTTRIMNFFFNPSKNPIDQFGSFKKAHPIWYFFLKYPIRLLGL